VTITSMYIRRTTVKSRKDGRQYYSYRIVESRRTENGVRQSTLLNLGVDFSLPREQWPVLAGRVKDIISGQSTLFELPKDLEAMAQKYAALIITSQKQPDSQIDDEPDYREVDINTMEALRPRSVGCEHVALQTFNNLKLDEKLIELGFNGPDVAAAVGTIIGRMCHPGSEKSTLKWLHDKSGLGELIDYDYGKINLDRMYRIADKLYHSKDEIERHLYSQEKQLFGFKETVALYDLTNTYFEGACLGNELAQRGHSKEKRKDCPLVTLGIVLDSSGFPKNSRVFEGNISESKTLAEIISSLDQGGSMGLFPQVKPTIVMDAGIATEENIQWLNENGYPYLVVSRKRHREFNEDEAVVVKEVGNCTVKCQKVLDQETGETLLYCHSSEREKKERAIADRFLQRFEDALHKLDKGLDKKGCLKNYDKVLVRIGRIKQENPRVASRFQIDVEKDEKTGKAIRIKWKQEPNPESKNAHPGVYCLRTSHQELDAKTLWNTYTMLTDLEAVFRSLKSELGLRPIFHQTKERVSAHLFITLIAYHLVHTIRYQLKSKEIHSSWATLREQLSGQSRITVSMRCKTDEMIYVRKSTRPEPMQQEIYNTLGVSHHPGKTIKTTMPAE
ncbi:MAG: IS1634 family transposase, partial [Desulfobacterales bacterium]